MSQNFDKTPLYAAKGPAYRQTQLSDNTHYNDPISHVAGELSGSSRRHGDASHNVQQKAIDAVKAAGKKHGMTEREIALTLAIARTESGFNPDAAAGTTSASGLGQFIDSTGAKYGLSDANRWNLNVQADALVRHTKENIALAKKRGYVGEDIDRYTYKFHHDGPSKDYGGLQIADQHVIPLVVLYEQYLQSEKPNTEKEPREIKKSTNKAGLNLSAPLSLSALFNNEWSQANRLLKLTTPLGASTLLVERVAGEEAVSQGYRFEITVLSTDAHLELKTLLGQPVLLELLTAHSRTDLRPFHGHVTRAEAVGANGGLARYRLILEPWTAFLAARRDARIFQDMNVLAILESVFKHYEGHGALAPAWRLDIADPGLYPLRSLTTQYQETDLAFVERLMVEEGLFYFYDHEGDASSPTRGRHTLVIADHNGAFAPNVQAAIEFTQPGAVMKRDSMDRWRGAQRLHTNAVALDGWDYRSRDTRPVAAHGGGDGLSLVSRDTPGLYPYPSREHGERRANNLLQALEAHNQTCTGAGTVRTLAPGTTFTLHGHAGQGLAALASALAGRAATPGTADPDNTFVVLRVIHFAHNNLSADLRGRIERALGALVERPLGAPGQAGDPDPTPGCPPGERPLYRNRIDALRRDIPYRAPATDERGRPLHPKPRPPGQQSAIVVGPAGQIIHTDRDHRIKVQFHWQRGDGSHSRLGHPHADGHTGAPADDRAGTWVRVATPLAPVAGANWGSHALPRIGQEVLIDFVEGDIDRPVVIGSLYNGRGQDDAQSNQVSHGTGSATGNAPAWFPGEKDGHAHPAALSGLKSQAMNSSQTGHGAYNQLVFDDSPGQGRTVLQHHAQPHQGTAELNLGHLRHQTDNQRLAPAGFGAELKTPHSAALRAGQGMLLSTDARRNASGAHLDSREAQAQIEHSHQLQTALASTAQKHNATLQGEPAADKLPALAQMHHSLDVVRSTADHGTGHPVTAYSEPHLQLSSPAGIAASTPAHAILSAGHTSSLTATDINLAAQGGSVHLVKGGISLFTYGKSSNPNKPSQETGLKLHAVSGKVSAQAQSSTMKIAADKTVTVASTTKSVTLAASKHVLLTAGGAYIKLAGGNIQVHGPGAMAFKASMKELAGPGGSTAALPRHC